MPLLADRPLLSRIRQQRQQRFGSGQRVQKVKSKAKTTTNRIKSRKPNVVPKVNEALSSWNVGEKIKEMLPLKTR